MLRILTLSTLYPNAAQPTFGLFVERQTRGLAARSDVELQTVSPVGLPPWPLDRHPHYARRASIALHETWNGITVHRPRFPVVPVIGTRWTAASMAKAALPILRGLRPYFPFDVIDAEFFWPDGPAAALLAAALGVPFSIKARGGDIHHWGARDDVRDQLLAAGRAAGGLLAVSHGLKKAMVALGIEESQITVHYTGVDLDLFRPVDRAAAKAELGVAGPLVVTVGALVERKGQDLALRAVQTIPEATLILVGDGPERRRLERLAGALGMSGRVRFAGGQPPQQVARLLAAADVMLLPSRSEGLANVWVEALACGTPVVTSDIDTAREAIAPGAGMLVARDPDALAAAVRALIASPPDPAALRDPVRRFSWEKNSSALYDHLSAVAAGHSRPAGR